MLTKTSGSLENDEIVYDEDKKKLSISADSLNAENIRKFVTTRAIRELHIIPTENFLLESLPHDFSDIFGSLEILFCSHQQFRTFPAVLGKCKNLKILGMKFAGIETILEDALPIGLEWLILTGNKIQALPESIGKLSKLKKLALSGNQLSSLPEGMKNCKNLELLRLSANNFSQEPPNWLFELPNLAWYSEAGNPFHTHKIQSSLEKLSMDELESEKTPLNKSGSSEVFKGRMRNEDVAIKVYSSDGGGKTLGSDGYAEDDLYYSSIFDGNTYPGFIPLQGIISDNTGKPILVMSYLGDDFKKLGNVPNFESITRDTFGAQMPDMHIGMMIEVIKMVAQSIKSMHNAGVVHGDIYAHNILFNGKSTYLSDFGASSNLRNKNFIVDILAFGLFIEDLLQHRLYSENISSINEGTKGIILLRKIIRTCRNKNTHKRPSFDEIINTLDSFSVESR